MAATARYPPSQQQQHSPNLSKYDNSTKSTLALNDMHELDRGRPTRTPSPTPSEAKELAREGAIDWRELSNWRYWIRWEWKWYYVALVVILTLTGLITIYHSQIVGWLKPATQWLHDLKFGWLVPIGVLFVISFPPLFGHEIVAVLCGLVWGIWIGFAIVSAGTFIGEVGNFYAFKYCCRARGEKLEKTKISYACLAKVVRDGGFFIALVARFSAIPGHFTTAVFSTCGMGIIVFSIAAILSMPKQFITVYLGVLLEQSETGTTDKKSKIISDVVLAITFLITLLAMWYIYHRMNKVKKDVIYERRKRRQGKLARASSSSTPYSYSTSSESTFRLASESAADIPLNAPGTKYDINGKPIYAPKPQNAYSMAQRYDDSESEDSHSYHYGAQPLQHASSFGRSYVPPPAGHDYNASQPSMRTYTPPAVTPTAGTRVPIQKDSVYYSGTPPPGEGQGQHERLPPGAALPIHSKFARKSLDVDFSRPTPKQSMSPPPLPQPVTQGPGGRRQSFTSQQQQQYGLGRMSMSPPPIQQQRQRQESPPRSPFDDPVPPASQLYPPVVASQPLHVQPQHAQMASHHAQVVSPPAHGQMANPNPYGVPQVSNPYLSTGAAGGHGRETTDASYMTAREPPGYEGDDDANPYMHGHGHHKVETTDGGTRVPGYLPPGF